MKIAKNADEEVQAVSSFRQGRRLTYNEVRAAANAKNEPSWTAMLQTDYTSVVSSLFDDTDNAPMNHSASNTDSDPNSTKVTLDFINAKLKNDRERAGQIVEEMKAAMANHTDDDTSDDSDGGNEYSRSRTAALQGAGISNTGESNAAGSDNDDRFHVVISNNFGRLF